MMPLSEIHQGDIYTNPMHRPDGISFLVEEKKDGLIKIQAYSRPPECKAISKPYWKKPKDSMFCPGWKIFCGKDQCCY